MKLIELCFFLLFLFVPIKKSLHMFQQNRYRKDRYLPWLQQQLCVKRKEVLENVLLLFLVYGLFFVSQEQFPQLLLGMLLLIYGYLDWRREELTTYRKPLVFTARAKRLWLMQLLVLLVLLLTMLHYGSVFWHIFFTPYLYFLPWFTILFSAMLLQPLEHFIQQSYMKQAKKKLCEHPELMIIGITGSYGKTSVKNILYHFMEETWFTLATPQSYNNRMGITKTILEQLQPLHEVFLCEMGADHVHEIYELMNFVKPQFGIVTAVGPQHLATFHSMENILKEKMQMIEQLDSDGVGFLNADNAWIRSYPLRIRAHIVWFGKDMLADYRYGNIQYDEDGTSFTITYRGKQYTFRTRLLGEHAVMNITCAIAVAHHMSISWEQLKRYTQQLPYVSHRLEKKSMGTYTILDDAYNANPSGARYAMDVLKAMKHQRIVITPGMIDLGSMQEKENEKFGRYMAHCADVVILVGVMQTRSIVRGLKEEQFASLHIHVVKDIHEAFTCLRKVAEPDAVVVLENDLPDAFNR